jgi:hypothetical protein
VTKHVRVAPGALIVGKPLPWTVFDSDGHVLLRQGYVIQNEMQLERLFKQGLFQPRVMDAEETDPESLEDTRARNPFVDYPSLLRALETTLTTITERQPLARKRLNGLARLIDRICQEAPDPCIALVHLYSVQPTANEQTLFYAIICHFVSVQLGLEENRRLVLMGAALTANIALLPFLDQLNNSSRGLSTKQRDVIRRHPLLSINALEEAGIDNPRLLEIIEHHHERHDGSGYPHGLSDDRIIFEARVLALAEAYTAMITRRGYRERFNVGQAMQSIRDTFRDQPRPAIYKALLNSLTIYPPGSLVRLFNNEIAVITHRSGAYGSHMAQAVIASDGQVYAEAKKRDCSLLDFNIRAVEDVTILPSMDFSQLWGFE